VGISGRRRLQRLRLIFRSHFQPPFGTPNLPLTFVRIALFSTKEGHGVFILYILRAIHHGNDFALGTDGLTDTHTLSNIIREFCNGIAQTAVPCFPQNSANL
jgi:hypothetical protein